MSLLKFVDSLVEARMFFGPKDLKNMSADEIASIVFIMIMMLEVIRAQDKTWAANYASQTLKYNTYENMQYSATDLGNLLAVLNNQDTFSAYIKTSSGVSIPLYQINRYLRGVDSKSISGHSDDVTFFWRLEDYLKLYSKSTLRQIRRDVGNWNDLTYKDRLQLIQILRREMDRQCSSVDMYLWFKQSFKLKESINPTQSDIEDVSKWLNTSPENVTVTTIEEPIEKFLPQIEEMYGTYDEFEEEEERTDKIVKLIKRGAPILPIYVEEGDPDLFVMEGRHRMVAFWLLGMKTIPVSYVKKKEVIVGN